MYSREYQDSEFFRYQLQMLIDWASEIPNVKEFFKNIHSLPIGLKLTNQVLVIQFIAAN